MSQAASQSVPEAPNAVVLPGPANISNDRWEQLSGLPCAISVDVPIPKFRLRDLIALKPDSIISSRLQTSSSVPLRVNGELIAWCDFEALGKRLCVRLTELA